MLELPFWSKMLGKTRPGLEEIKPDLFIRWHFGPELFSLIVVGGSLPIPVLQRCCLTRPFVNQHLPFLFPGFFLLNWPFQQALKVEFTSPVSGDEMGSVVLDFVETLNVCLGW